MDIIYYFFVLAHPLFPMPRLMVVPIQAIFAGIFLLFMPFKKLTLASRRMYPLQIVFLGFFAWVCVADLLNLARIASQSEFLHMAGRQVFLIIILATYFMARDQQRFERILKLLITGVLLMALFTIACAILKINPLGAHESEGYREFYGTAMPFHRTIGVLKSYGEYGVIANSVLPLLLVSAWKKDFLVRRSLAIGLIFILLFAVFVTGSRNCYLGTLMVFFFFTLVLGFRSRDFAIGLLLFLAISFFLMISVVFLSDYFIAAFKGFAMGRTQFHSFLGRLEMDKVAFDIFKKNWMFGVGHEEITRRITALLGIDAVVHNGYLDQMASSGIFGFIPFIAVLFTTLGGFLQMARRAASPWNIYALCLAASFVANMVLLNGYKGFFSPTFAMEYGLFLSLVEFSREAPTVKVAEVEISMAASPSPAVQS